MDVEDVPGESFPPGRPAEEEGKLPVGACMMSEVIIND